MTKSALNTSPKPWNTTFVRTLGALALLGPLFGALLYHADALSVIGQTRFGPSFGRSFIWLSLLSMMLMPRDFRRILDRKGNIDEREMYWRSVAYHVAYRLIVVVMLLLIAGAGLAANRGLESLEMRHLLVTIFMMALAYALIIPFNILAWRMSPPDTD